MIQSCQFSESVAFGVLISEPPSVPQTLSQVSITDL